jgi:hypothetical protein
LSEKWLTEAEMAEAEERKRQFAQAADSLNDEQRRAVLFGQIVNELLMVRAKLQKLIDSQEMVNFDHYLRLRATQKLLVNVNQRLNSVRELDYITADDLFLLEVAQELLAQTPILTDLQLQRLNRLVSERFDKELAPFVFEELVRGWALALNSDEAMYVEKRALLSLDEAVLQILEHNLNMGILLSSEEKNQLKELKNRLPDQQIAADDLFKSIQHRNHFIDSAEGLLQALENKVGDIEMNLMIPQVGEIIIACMEKGRKWEQLSEEEQCLITDFANIFRQARVERGKELEAESNAMVLVEVAA